MFGCHISVHCKDLQARSLLTLNYGHLIGRHGTPDLVYTISGERRGGSRVLCISRADQEVLTALDAGEFLFLFEKDMTIELQKLRSDLYFIHAAALELAGRAFMLAGASGSGKSTTTWALLHHGFRYLSDELAPVDLQTLRIHPYPHALCLKTSPPLPYGLPVRALHTSRTIHVPVDALPHEVCPRPSRLRAIFFQRYRPEASTPAVRPVSSAEAATRLYTNTLNALAHAGDGLDGAIALAHKAACFELFTANLPATCALLKTTLEGLGDPGEPDGPADE